MHPSGHRHPRSRTIRIPRAQPTQLCSQANSLRRSPLKSFTPFCWMASALIQQLPKILLQQSQSLAAKICWFGVWQIGRALRRRMILRMTRTQTRPYGVVTPSSRQPLLEAMLRAFAWLVSNAVSLFGMTINRNTRDWHTDAAREDQPTPNDLTQETRQAEPTGLSTGSGLKPASPAQAGVQTPHEVRTRNPSALRTLTGPPPSRGTRVERHARILSPVIPGEGAQRRRPGTQELHARSAHEASGFRLTRSARVRNDNVCV